MKHRIVAAGVALALALTPLAGVDAKSNSGFSSATKSAGTAYSAKPEAGGRGFNGFSKADPPKTETRAVDLPKTNNGFSAFSKQDERKPDVAPPAAAAPRQQNGFSAAAPAQPATTAQQPVARTNNGFSAAGATGAGVGAAAVAKPAQAQPSAVDRLAQKSNGQSAFAKFKQEQQAYRAPPVAPPVSQAAARSSQAWTQYGSGWNDPNAYARQRQAAFDRQPDIYVRYYQHPPSFIRSAAYGALAGGFLALMLDHVTDPGYSSWAYSHQNDPDYMEWHRDMMDQARDNADLREKMARLDQQVADMKSQNAPITTALPQGVDASMVVAPETAAMATTPDEPTGHPIWTFIKWVAFGIVGVAAFLAACVFVSQRKKAYS